ncbi:MAG: WecB/TagA/CpsF family glycosyltransferase [Myxococcales bacterium]|nr:WecB/TagA/CpsF family glycosyltransferase [Myxococcales bacterium]MDH3485276.1 WecB/TagA/CpsF family glycosyltransferase [Myxococcales bacterium]
MKRVRLGRIYGHALTFSEALEKVAEIIARGRGGYVVTPNVDHVVQAEHSEELRAAYEGASLSLVDGQPLIWLSRLMGEPFPEKISGSDLVPPLMEMAAKNGWRVLFLGAAEGVGAKAAQVLRKREPSLQIVATLSPPFGFDAEPEERDRVLQLVREAKPDLVVMALGCPKQELLMHRWKNDIAPAVAIGSGATLDFIAGNVSRSPVWMSDAGLEWLYRLAREPRRLAYRYLVRDPKILKVAWQMLRLPPEARVLEETQTGGR